MLIIASFGGCWIILNRTHAANLYLKVILPWENYYKSLPDGYRFDIRGKKFKAFIKNHGILIKTYPNIKETEVALSSLVGSNENKDQFIIFRHGDESKARSIFKHLRNATAHGNVRVIKIKGKRYYLFEAYEVKNRLQGKKKIFVASIKCSIFLEFM